MSIPGDPFQSHPDPYPGVSGNASRQNSPFDWPGDSSTRSGNPFEDPAFPGSTEVGFAAPSVMAPYPSPYGVPGSAGSGARSGSVAGLGSGAKVTGGWWGLGLVGLGTVGGLVFLYLVFTEIRIISTHPLGNALLWGSAWAVACAVVTVGMIVAVVGLIRRKRPWVQALALAIGILIAPIAFFADAQLGVDTMLDQARSDVGPAAGEGISALAAYAQSQGIDLGPLKPVLSALGAD